MTDQTPEPYTPTLAEIRDSYPVNDSDLANYPPEIFVRPLITIEAFDRALAAHDREVAERAEKAGAFKVWDLLNATGHDLGPNPYTEESRND